MSLGKRPNLCRPCILWPCHLDLCPFDLILFDEQLDSSWTILVASLVVVLSAILVRLTSTAFNTYDLDLWPFDLTIIPSVRYHKIKFEHFGIIFWVIMWTNKQAKKRTESETDADEHHTHATTDNDDAFVFVVFCSCTVHSGLAKTESCAAAASATWLASSTEEHSA